MADKTNTWFSGARAITGAPPVVQPRSVPLAPASRNGNIARTVLVGVGIAVCTFLALGMIPIPWAWESLRVMAVGIILLSIFYFPTEVLQPSFVIWWLMLISECIFFREGDVNSNANAYQGSFPTAAYGEVVMWGLCFLAVLVCAGRIRGYFIQLFAGDYKWLTVFAALCLGSCLYTPRPSLGLVWSFKLGLVVLLLLVCSNQMRDLQDTEAFLRFTTWAYAIIIFQPVLIAMFRGVLFDEEGRMSTIVSPNALSPNAGVVVLLALTLFSTQQGKGMRKSAIFLGIVACVIMILAGSKTGIMAALFSGGMFFFFRKRFGSAFGYIAATGVLIAVLALTTPLGSYFHTYREGQGAESFSGRTLLWSAVWPAIKQKPIVGHGYMSSEFIGFQVNAVGWTAPHLHNGFLESLYNNGLLGFIAMVAITIVIPLKLYRVLRVAPATERIYRIAAGCLCLYAFLLINGIFNSSFGGKATAPFMLMLALVPVSNKLCAIAARAGANEQPIELYARAGG
ncbi:MAG TPA: O-antigen ligase family protein [Candidatus Sulfotelmatobacter sp.]|nr:O-antigen ligase family protein [Candidatus Sulfotelmatobacter sp.]